MTKSRKRTTLVILGVVAAVLTMAVVIVGLALFRRAGAGEYERKIQLAQRCVDNEDYDGAISAYYAAIDLNDKNDVAYLGLADVYERTGQLNYLNYILNTGYDKTGSKEINDRLDHMDHQMLDSKTEIALAQLNETALQRFSYTTYEEMQASYNPTRGSAKQEITSVKGVTLETETAICVHFLDSGVSAYFSNTPQENSVPVEIHLDDLRTIFYATGAELTYPELTGMGLNDLQLLTLSGVGPAITFRSMGCTVYVACDEDGTISQWDAWNCIVPDRNGKQDNDEESSETYVLQGKIRNATTGQGVDGAVIILYDENGGKQGEFECQEDGSYRIEDLPEGNYELEISASGYVDEQETFYVDSWSDQQEQEFVISPVLEAGQVRIVLTWGALPPDLDSHCFTDDGGHVFWSSRVHRIGNDVVAELDVDDTDGNGPETITIYNTKGYFHYMVEDYTKSGGIAASGAQVKIYRDDGSAPIVLDANSEAGNYWDVLEIRNGEIEIIDEPADRMG